MSFELEGSMKDAKRLTERLKVALLAASLGGVETLVSQPSIMTHTQLTMAERAKTGKCVDHRSSSYWSTPWATKPPPEPSR